MVLREVLQLDQAASPSPGSVGAVELEFAQGQFTRATVIVLLVITLIAAVVSMICYLLYYGLDKVKGYVDGMMPLLLVAVMMAVVTAGAVASHK